MVLFIFLGAFVAEGFCHQDTKAPSFPINIILIEKDVIIRFEPQPEIWSAGFTFLWNIFP